MERTIVCFFALSVDFRSIEIHSGAHASGERAAKFRTTNTLQVSGLQDEVEQLRIQLNDALAERDQGVAALRAYEELLKRINESNAKQKGYASLDSLCKPRHETAAWRSSFHS